MTLLGRVEDGKAPVVFGLAHAVFMVAVEHEVGAYHAARLVGSLALHLQPVVGNHRLQGFQNFALIFGHINVLHSNKYPVGNPVVEPGCKLVGLWRVAVRAPDGLGDAAREQGLAVTWRALNEWCPLEFDAGVLHHGRHVGQNNLSVARHGQYLLQVVEEWPGVAFFARGLDGHVAVDVGEVALLPYLARTLAGVKLAGVGLGKAHVTALQEGLPCGFGRLALIAVQRVGESPAHRIEPALVEAVAARHEYGVGAHDVGAPGEHHFHILGLEPSFPHHVAHARGRLGRFHLFVFAHVALLADGPQHRALDVAAVLGPLGALQGAAVHERGNALAVFAGPECKVLRQRRVRTRCVVAAVGIRVGLAQGRKVRVPQLLE